MPRVRLPCVALLLAAASAASVPRDARADGASSQRADALFKEGSDALARGRYVEACAKLEESNRISPASGTQYNLAICLEMTRKQASARRLYTRVATDADAAGKKALAKEARERATKLDAIVPRILVQVPAGSTEVGVRLDGASIAPSAVTAPLEVDPGSHELMVTAADQEPFEKRVDAVENATQTVVVKFTPKRKAVDVPPKASPPPAVPDAASPPPWRTIGLVGAGVGLVAVGVGGYFGLKAKSASDDSGCSGGRCPSQAGLDRLDDAKTSANLSTIFVVAGAVVATAGIVLFVVDPGHGAPGPRAALSFTGSGVALAGEWR